MISSCIFNKQMTNAIFYKVILIISLTLPRFYCAVIYYLI